MSDLGDDERRVVLDSLSAAFLSEISLRSPDAATTCADWPTAADLVEHVGGIYAWVSTILRTGTSVDRRTLPGSPAGATADWFSAQRTELLATLASTAPNAQCWTLLSREGESRFWLRRMVFETAKHLCDLRCAGSEVPLQSLAELSPAAAADGIDELFDVFLSRSRPTLAPLPGSLALVATDSARRWHVSPTWQITQAATADATLEAPTRELLLFAWDRADPFALGDRFAVAGDEAIVRAFTAAPIHP